MTVVETTSEAETAAAGHELAKRLEPGDVVLIEGTLGAGKTVFVRGLAEGLGLDADDVTSPTFTIVQEYRRAANARADPSRPVTLQHIDLYRLTPAEVDDLGLDDLIEGRITAIEWPERWTDPPPSIVRVKIAVLNDHQRRITTSGVRSDVL